LGHVAPRRQQERSPKEVWSLRIRLVVTAVLVVTAFAAAPFVAVRSVDPGKGWLIIEPLVGALYFWPLARVLIRSSTLFWGTLLSLIAPVSMTCIRIFGSHRDAIAATESNFSYGAMIFFGVMSMAAYILFRNPPHGE
tara:strand:+ start:1380 stop:1793 length:414 start_codon:yes stop_codon:yes gene_type:complete